MGRVRTFESDPGTLRIVAGDMSRPDFLKFLQDLFFGGSGRLSCHLMP